MAGIRVVVLAAGQGRRMGAELPKPLVPIAGKPMIAHLLDRVAQSGIDPQPIVVVAPDSINAFRTALGERCDFAIQKEQRGTGDAVMAAKDAAGEAEHIFVLYGDHPFVSPKTLLTLWDLHARDHVAISMLTTTVPNFDGPYATFQSWGRIVRSSSGEIVESKEAKDATPEELAICELNPCLYIFEAKWLWEQLPKLGNNNASHEFYLTDLVRNALLQGERVVTAPAEPFEVVGINTPTELAGAEAIFTGKDRQRNG